MDLGLQGKVALVTGGSRGIGEGIARALAAEGCRLVLCARGAERLEQAAASIGEASGVEVLSLAGDVMDLAAGERSVAAAVERFGRLDILINSAGGNRRKPFPEITDEDWTLLIEWNLLAHARFSRAAIPALRRQPGSSILFVASIFGREVGGPGLALYDTTKSALISLAKTMALDLAPEGIRVNSLAPGSIRFPGGSWDERCKKEPEAMAEFVARNLPLGRFGSVEEIGNAAAFLVSERASWVTGACFNVDGGQSRSLI
ncbi:MAG: SDR family oxidoreductase [Acidobacteriota bacterium]